MSIRDLHKGITISIYVSSEDYQNLVLLSNIEARSVSDVMRRALRKYIELHKQEERDKKDF